jgi:homoserine dehydrogenase
VTRVALLGFGTVGSAVARRLAAPGPAFGTIQLTQIFDRRADAKRGSLAAGSTVGWTSRVDDVLQGDADIVVETVGGVDPVADWIRQALLAGKSVVTANKQLVARDGPALWKLAARQGRQFRFEAAVGGAMPIVRAIEGLAGDALSRVTAILNGTTNAVLSQMELTGCALREALACAREAGYAEADAAADLDGDDARAKLAILCALAFGVRVDPSDIAAQSCAGITPGDVADARRRGGTLRQLAHARCDDGLLTAWVAPVVVPRGSLFAGTIGPQNAAVVTGRSSGDIGIFGAGAGGEATSVAVVSDVAAIARDRAAVVPAPALTAPVSIAGRPPRTRRFEDADPAVLAAFDRRLGSHHFQAEAV